MRWTEIYEKPRQEDAANSQDSDKNDGSFSVITRHPAFVILPVAQRSIGEEAGLLPEVSPRHSGGGAVGQRAQPLWQRQSIYPELV